MKIIFLDIDGVLNSEKTAERLNGFLGIDRNLLHRFHVMMRLLPDVDIVLSSSWRRHSDLVKEIERAGIRPIGHTPYLLDDSGFHDIRGREIAAWLERNAHKGVERYAIIDDDSDMLPDQPLFQTSFKKGLTHKVVHAVVKYFNEQTEGDQLQRTVPLPAKAD